MPFAKYGTLKDVIQHINPQFKIDVRSHRLKWAQQIASAMEYLYQNGIMHHDLKSSNILVFNDSLVTP